MKKKLEQQHEEELERKDAIKKQLERKVTFLRNELLQYASLTRSNFKKHMCMCVFHHHCFFLFFVLFCFLFFFGSNIQKILFNAFFGKRCVFFPVEPSMFLGKHIYSEGFGHKEVKFLLNSVIILFLFLGEKIWNCCNQHKVHSYMWYCPYIALDMIEISRNNDKIENILQ